MGGMGDELITLYPDRRCSPRGLVGMPADKVLLGRGRGDDDLGACQHGDQCSGCPASMPNLARP